MQTLYLSCLEMRLDWIGMHGIEVHQWSICPRKSAPKHVLISLLLSIERSDSLPALLTDCFAKLIFAKCLFLVHYVARLSRCQGFKAFIGLFGTQSFTIHERRFAW